MTTKSLLFFVFASSCFFVSCNNSTTSVANESDSTIANAQLKADNTTFKSDSTNMNGYFVYNENVQGKRPGILIVPEWWGLNDYVKGRARELAKLGYAAMAVDVYGNGQIASTPDEAKQLAGPFYQNPQLAKTRLDAAIAQLKAYPQVDTSNIAAIGYCFGGYVALNAAKLGADLKGVVSFHGDLSGVKPDKNLLKAKLLILHGAADSIVNHQAVEQFKHQMDSIGADYTFKSYPKAKHSFTNPASDSVENKYHIGVGYNAEADKQSWAEMREFLRRIFNR